MMRLTVSSKGLFSVLIQSVHEYLCVGMHVNLNFRNLVSCGVVLQCFARQQIRRKMG